jgi:hypothetical protein
MVSKFLGYSALALALIAPSFALAQTSTTGLLNVYVQVTNQSGFSYTPGNFTVSVSGNSATPSTFQGSQSGTLVSLNPGAFSVIVTNQNGYTPSYSTGCNNTIAAGQTHTCVVTLNATNLYNYPTLYPYPSSYQPSLSCRTDTPTVGLGQTARFTAVGGVGGTYNWTTPTQNYPNVGPVLTVTFPQSGSQVVGVTNGSQTTYCNITVTNTYYPYPTTNTYPTYAQPTLSVNPVYSYSGYSYPSFPNTGFAPFGATETAFAVVLLMGAGIAVTPYARKAIALAVR